MEDINEKLKQEQELEKAVRERLTKTYKDGIKIGIGYAVKIVMEIYNKTQESASTRLEKIKKFCENPSLFKQ